MHVLSAEDAREVCQVWAATCRSVDQWGRLVLSRSEKRMPAAHFERAVE
jgi:hypothetical protein